MELIKHFSFILPYINDLFDQDVMVTVSFDRDFNIQQSNIVILTTDHWGDDEYLLTPPDCRPQSMIDCLKIKVRQYPTKTFYLMTVCPFLEEFFTDEKNLIVIHWGNDFMLHPDTDYSGISPVMEKEFSKNWHWVSLSNNLRVHRSICHLILLGLDIKHGYQRFDPSWIIRHESWKSFKSYLKYNKYPYLNSISRKFYPVMEKGFLKVKNSEGYDAKKYLHRDNKSAEVGMNLKENFNQSLKNVFYQHSVIEVVTETVFINQTGIITEKYLNTVYGSNFPIIIGMHRTVAHLRSLGFDMFDDIIDHSYDEIVDPYVRMTKAITDNRKMLEDKGVAISAWFDCQDRFQQNYRLIEAIYQNKEHMVKQQIHNTLDRKKTRN